MAQFDRRWTAGHRRRQEKTVLEHLKVINQEILELAMWCFRQPALGRSWLFR